MKAEGLSQAAIDAFKYTYFKLASGASLFTPESSIEPVGGTARHNLQPPEPHSCAHLWRVARTELPDYAKLTAEDPKLLEKTVMLKLNGGLGTGMGLEKVPLPLLSRAVPSGSLARSAAETRGALSRCALTLRLSASVGS